MMDEEDIMNEKCADLVSVARLEPALIHLFGTKLPGEWVRVRDLYQIAGQSTDGIKPGLAASWLPSPDTTGYAVVLFYDEDSLWSTTAWYNAARLREQHPPIAVAAAS